MPTTLRSAVFSLCKVVKEKAAAKEIAELVYNLSVPIESKETGEKCPNPHGNLGYLAQRSNCEFQGYLFFDDNADEIELPIYLKAGHLSKAERVLIEKGHKTITRVLEMCLCDIKQESTVAAEVINPYSQLKKVNLVQAEETLLTDEEIQPVVSAFKRGAVYRALLDSKFTHICQQIGVKNLQASMKALAKEIRDSLGEDASQSMKELTLRLRSHVNPESDIVIAYIILMYALRESLKQICQLLYKAICGGDLFVLNNDNIINIEMRSSNSVCYFYKVFSQEIFLSHFENNVGSVVLLDCDPSKHTHLHEFGIVIATTINLSGEFGQTAKYSLVTINEELIYIPHLTEAVLQAGLPEVRIHPEK